MSRLFLSGLMMLMFVVCVEGSPLQRSSQEVDSAQVARVAVLAYRPKPETVARWMPLVAYLQQQVPGVNFELSVYTHDELDSAVNRQDVDFVLTQPAHYVRLTYSHQLTSPLATLYTLAPHQAVDRFGGVIFVRNDRDDIHGLADLKNRFVATAALASLGSYQMQAFELIQAGVGLPKGAWIVETGQPQDRVLELVLNTQADVGFVRTGVLESWVQSGRIGPDTFRVINPQNIPGFDLLSSTRLYPEWPFAALDHVDRDLARRVAAALLAMPHGSELAQSMQMAGFGIPGDYRMIDELLRALRLGPFDAPVTVSWQDVWRQWQGLWLGILLFLVLGAVVFTVVLYRRNKDLSLAKRSLQKQSTRLSSLLQALPDPVWLKDSQGCYLECNHRFEEVFGQPRRKIIGRHDRDFFDSEVTQRLRKHDSDALSSDRRVTHEEWITHPDGEKRFYEIVKTPMHDRRKRVIGILGIGRDITLRNEHEEMLESFNQILNERVVEEVHEKEEKQKAMIAQSRVAAMGEMVSAMAHHWRQPLTAISLLAQGLKEAYDFEDLDQELMDRSVEKIVMVIWELSQTISDLRAFHDEGRPPQAIVLHDEVMQVANLLSSQLAMANITIQGSHLEGKPDPDTPKVWVEAAAFRQVLFNLITNARDAIVQTGRQPGLVEIDIRHQEDGLALVVSDNGGGIGEAIMDRIFEPFFTTKERGRGAGIISGAGLGLYVTKQIVEEQIKGTIRVHNSPDGAVFTVVLPKAP